MGSAREYCVVLALVVITAMPLAGCKTQGTTSALSGGIRAGEPAPWENENFIDKTAGAGLRSVFFDYDSADLSPDALETLKRNAELLKGAPGVRVLIEGHCDERGTQEYNLVLGERRAAVVKEQLVRLGVEANRLSTISYGNEKPAVQGHDDGAWRQNRRCEFVRPPA